MNPQRAGLLADLAETPRHLMRVLADEADDAGEPWLAAGWRWLAENRKWPWWVNVPPDGPLRWGWSLTSGPPSARLPDGARAFYPDGEKPGKKKRYDTLEECLLAGAVAAGKWLESEAVKAEAKKQEAEARKAIAGCTLCKGTGEVTYSTGMREPCQKCAPLLKQFPPLLQWHPAPDGAAPRRHVAPLFGDGGPVLLDPRSFIRAAEAQESSDSSTPSKASPPASP